MAFRFGQNCMNFVNILKLYTEHIKSFDMKSNRANSSLNFKKINEYPNHITDYFNSYVESHIIKTKPSSKHIKHYKQASRAKKYVDYPKNKSKGNECKNRNV